MSLDYATIKGSLVTALQMHPPKFEQGAGGSAKVSALEDYLLESAWMRAELEEGLHWLGELVEHYKGEVEKITGYEVALPHKPQDRITQQDIISAKRQIAPTIFEAGAEARRVREGIVRQINRFEFEAQWVVSRAYTMISGG